MRYLALILTIVVLLAVSCSSEPEPQPAPDDGGTKTEKVIGGEPVKDGQYAFASAILDETYGKTPDEQQFCTASLIDHNSVVTAAHCMKGMRPADMQVTVGKTVLTSDQGYLRDATSKYIHPDWGKPCSDCHDVAVLNFSPAVDDIQPIGIGGNALENPGNRVTVAGWGALNPNGSKYPDRMYAATVSVESDQRGEDQEGKYFKDSLMILAGAKDKDSCSGDSGGPLFDRTDTGYKQIGVVSYGPMPCADAKLRGVYTELNAPSVKSFVLESAKKNN